MGTRFRRLFLAVPAAAGVAAVVFAVGRSGVEAAVAVPKDSVIAVVAAPDAGVAVAVVNVDSAGGALDALALFDDEADDGLLALADDSDDDDGDDFAIPGLAGSSDRELEDIEAALDRALKL